MERYLSIAKVNLKFNLIYYVLAALVFCLVSPLLMGLKNLEATQVAKVLETYISMLGIILLIPVVTVEDNKYLRELVLSKRQSMVGIYIIRVFQSVIFLGLIISIFLLYMKMNNCIFDFGQYLYISTATCIFLGGLGILSYALFQNIVVAYIIPCLYYIICFMGIKKYLGRFYLFSMMNGSIVEKHYIILFGVTMMVAGIIINLKRDKIIKFCLKLT